MEVNVKNFETLSGVTEYWSQCLSRLDSRKDQDVAYDMVRIVANDRWDEWYNENKGEPLFVETFDLVADLETPIERELSREEMWRRVKKNVAALQKKYSK